MKGLPLPKVSRTLWTACSSVVFVLFLKGGITIAKIDQEQMNKNSQGLAKLESLGSQ